jgi:hypothetical protein
MRRRGPMTADSRAGPTTPSCQRRLAGNLAGCRVPHRRPVTAAQLRALDYAPTRAAAITERGFDLPKLGGVAERALGFFRFGTGFWLMYLVFAVALV